MTTPKRDNSSGSKTSIVTLALAALLGSCTSVTSPSPAHPGSDDAAPTATASQKARIEFLEQEVKAMRQEIDELSAANQKLIDSANDNGPYAGRLKPDRPEPGKVYPAPIAGAPQSGPSDALVTMVEASEYACPFCEKSRHTVKRLQTKYGANLRVVHQPFVVHPRATFASLAACAAGKQDKFEKMDELLWDKAYREQTFDDVSIIALADRAGLNMKRFKSDTSTVCKTFLDKTKGALQALNVRGTPTFFINGRVLTGAQPMDRFETIVDEELAKAKAAIASDTALTKSNYYSKAVLKK